MIVKEVAAALMLAMYLTTHVTVTSAQPTESAVGAAATSKISYPETGSRHLPLSAVPPYVEIQDTNPSYFYPYPQIPYNDDPRSRFYYPLNSYQNGGYGYPQNGLYPQTGLNRYPNYPQNGYQIPSGYPYGNGFQYPVSYY